MPLDPLTAALELATALTNAYTAFLAGATPEQREKLVAFWIEDQQFWRTLFKKLQPKD